MHESIFAEFSLILALGAGMALLMRLLRQPLIIGHILTGVLVGPLALHVIRTPETIEVFSSIGIALLLFIIGLGLNPQVIREVGKVSAAAGILQVGFSTLLGFGAGIVLGLGTLASLFLGLGLAFSSTIIILKLLSDKKEQTRLYGKVLTGILLVQDLFAATALLFITAQAGSGITVSSLAALVLKGSLIAIPLFFLGLVVLPRLHKFIAESQEFLFLFSIGWGFGFAALFERAGFSLEVGALLAGVSLASLPYTQEISARLRPLRDFFIVVFFITLGTRLSFGHIGTILPVVLIGSFIVVVLKPLLVLSIMGLLGYTKRTSFKAALATAQISEFSIVFIVLGNKQGLVSDDLVSIITLIALISITISAYLIIYSDNIFNALEENLHMFERQKNRGENERHHKNELALFGYRKGGHEFLKVFRAMGKRFVVVDYDPEAIDVLEHLKANYVYGDVSDIELLDEIGLEKVRLSVSTITDFTTSKFLVELLLQHNPNMVVICHAENVAEADHLYALGASYVMMPHYIGSRQIGAIIKKSGLKRSEFKRFREKHQEYIHTHYSLEAEIDS
ncbi:MAG TPA: cation:proton antiporter [Candidatus Saccharibacteria bacterium]|nr:cation:proton antiporter [Candidatus Saccharibacteria bacterium]